MLKREHVTEEAAFEALSKVLGGSQYKEAAMKVSQRMRARRRTPPQEAGGMVQTLMLVPKQCCSCLYRYSSMCSISNIKRLHPCQKPCQSQLSTPASEMAVLLVVILVL